MGPKVKKGLKEINLWEITGKTATVFALAGTITGPLTFMAVQHFMAASGDSSVKEIKGSDLAYMSMKGAESMSLTGLFTAGVICLAARRQRNQAAKNQSNQPTSTQP